MTKEQRDKLARLVASEAVNCGMWSPDRGSFFIQVASEEAILEWARELEVELHLGESLETWLSKEDTVDTEQTMDTEQTVVSITVENLAELMIQAVDWAFGRIDDEELDINIHPLLEEPKPSPEVVKAFTEAWFKEW